MKEILNTMLSALTRGEGVMLCSILKADGSSPRGAGAHMAVFSDGTALGTVGGGAVERQSILLARELLEGKRNALRDFALRPEAANSAGMVCGGDVTVWFQYIPPENAAQIGVLRAWRDALGSGRNVWLCLVLDGETLREFRLLTADELRHGTEGFFTSRPYWDGSTFVEPIVRAGRVYLFGAGHVGRALAPVLHYIGFEVTVYDNRAELANAEHFPTAHEIIVGDFRRIFDKVSLTADDYAVVMTPGHQADYEILEQVLRTPATYIGCIGSRKKVALTRERLAAAGFSQQDIDRVHAPIGLPILAETPEEIAISVAAEMIRHRAEHL